MKILITTDLFTTATNGVVTSVKNLVNELESKGHDVRILTLSEGHNSYKVGNVYYIKSISIGAVYPDVRMAVSYRNDFVRELILWKPDVIHSQCEFFSFQFAKRISKFTGAPIIHTYHTLYEQYVTYVIPFKKLGRHIVSVMSRKRLKKVNRIIAPTYKVKAALRSYGVRNAISVVPSGISISQHNERLSEEERRQKRQALGIDDDKFVLINLGRLGTEKNLDELVTLFAEALKYNENLILMIVGDGPAKEQLEKQAASLGIADKVIFTGMVQPSEVQKYYQLGDVFVSASTSETQGLTYVEAAANGLPLLCRKDLCLKGVIKQGENGYEYTNAKEFLQNIKLILSNPKWAKEAGRKSQEIAVLFDKSTFGDSVEAIYKSIVKQSA